jgi:predicted enzyme related to lactoylglutathione lyase
MSTIVLWVSDIKRQANFYSALLGAPITNMGDEFCAVGDMKNSVLLHLLPQQYRSSNSALAPAQEEVAIKPVFKVVSIQEAISRATVFEIRLLGAVATYGNANYQDCIDPEGNVIQLSN